MKLSHLYLEIHEKPSSFSLSCLIFKIYLHLYKKSFIFFIFISPLLIFFSSMLSSLVVLYTLFSNLMFLCFRIILFSSSHLFITFSLFPLLSPSDFILSLSLSSFSSPNHFCFPTSLLSGFTLPFFLCLPIFTNSFFQAFSHLLFVSLIHLLSLPLPC